MMPQRYAGTPDAPFPPCPPDWLEVPATDRLARARAHTLVDQLAPYTFVDERGPSGLVRYFAYETAFGRTVSAIAPQDGEGTLGAADVQDPATQAAATAMNNALLAHGYKYADMGLYKAFQQLAGVQVDGYPGTTTMTELKDVLFAMGVEIAPVPVYVWAPGAYDGVNAPTAAQWAAPGGATPTVPSGTTPLTTIEPVPATDATCGSWVADVSNPQALAIASTIAFHDSPVPWVDQGDYSTTIGGVDYLFVMWWEAGLKSIAAFTCTSGPAAGTTPATTASAASSSSGATAVIVGVLVVGGLVATGFAARKPLKAAYSHRMTRR